MKILLLFAFILVSCAASPKIETDTSALALSKKEKQDSAKILPKLNMAAELAKLDTMLAADSPNATAAHEHFLRALDMVEDDKYQFAELFYKRALAYEPNSHFLLFELIKILLRNGKTDEAFPLVRLSVQSPSATSEDYLLLGKLYKEKANLDSALFYYKIALEKREGDLSVLYEYSQLLEVAKNYPELKRIYGILLPELDYPPRLLEKQLLLYQITQTPDSATAELLGAAFGANGISYAEYGFLQAEILTSLKKYNEANEVLLTIFFMTPSSELSSRVALRIANNYDLMDSTTVAVIWLEQLLAKEPENHVAANNLGYMLIDHDIDVKRGLSLIDSALKYSPAEQSYLDSKAWGLYKIGSFEESLKILEQLENSGMAAPELWEHLAAVCKALKLDEREKIYREKINEN